MTTNAPESMPYTNRWRDDAFYTLYYRWTLAQQVWKRALGSIAGGWTKALGEGDWAFDPDPSRIQDETLRAKAQEYQDARAAYKADIAWRMKEEGLE